MKCRQEGSQNQLRLLRTIRIHQRLTGQLRNLPVVGSYSDTSMLQEVQQTSLGETDVGGVPIHVTKRTSPCSGVLEIERVHRSERGLLVVSGEIQGGGSLEEDEDYDQLLSLEDGHLYAWSDG